MNLMRLAAPLKAAGNSWDVIAAKLHRCARNCRRWPTLYPAEWQRLFFAAADALLGEAGGESFYLLRKLARSEDVQVSKDVNKFLYRHSFLMRVQLLKLLGQLEGETINSKWAPFVALVDKLSHEELQSLFDHAVAQRPAATADAQDADAGGGGPEVAE